MSLVIPSDFDDYGGSGTYSEEDLQMAIDLAEHDIAFELNTYLEPTEDTWETIWPPWIVTGKQNLKEYSNQYLNTL